MREIRLSGSEGGEAEVNRPSLPLSAQAEGLGLRAGLRVGFPQTVPRPVFSVFETSYKHWTFSHIPRILFNSHPCP
jgi:hypothetical protein